MASNSNKLLIPFFIFRETSWLYGYKVTKFRPPPQIPASFIRFINFIRFKKGRARDPPFFILHKLKGLANYKFLTVLDVDAGLCGISHLDALQVEDAVVF